jgi:ribosomal protein L30
MSNNYKLIRATQIRSAIRREQKQKDILKVLRLKINKTIELEYNPSNFGLVNKISHLLKLELI